jgi:glycosyltransferase involved in cell wall biosynthesis
MAKFLARRGWGVTVLTPHPSVWRRVEDLERLEAELKREGIQRLLTGHRWRCLSPTNLRCRNDGVSWLLGGICRRTARRLGVDPAVGWIRPAERACAALTADDVDLILATAPPFSPFTLARRLSRRLRRPYVLDYRDLWSRNPHYRVPSATRVEAPLLAGCAAVTTVSPSWAEILARDFDVADRLHVVSNGYDPEELSSVAPYPFDHFAIVYTGSLYPPKRVLSPLLAALQRLHQMAPAGLPDWRFHYYGWDADLVRDDVERFGLTARVVIHGMVPRSEALSAVKGAGVVVVISSVADRATEEDNGIVPGKVFEAIGLGTATLVICPPAADPTVVAETTGLARSFSGSDIPGIASFLHSLMEGHSLHPAAPASYSWENIVARLDPILRGAISSGA